MKIPHVYKLKAAIFTTDVCEYKNIFEYVLGIT